MIASLVGMLVSEREIVLGELAVCEKDTQKLGSRVPKRRAGHLNGRLQRTDRQRLITGPGGPRNVVLR